MRKHNQDNRYHVICECYQDYRSWTKKHTINAAELQRCADETMLYKVFPDKVVNVVINGKQTCYTGTIYSTTCSKVASTKGKHPFQCYNCFSLIHGKSSALLRKYHWRNQLKYPCPDQLRATRSSVNHKYCLEMHLESAIKHQKDTYKVQKTKTLKMMQRMQNMLHESWHQCDSVTPFLKTLLTWPNWRKQSSSFDMSFIQNWVQKKAHGRYCRADAQACALAVLYSNRLGENLYWISTHTGSSRSLASTTIKTKRMWSWALHTRD